MGFHLIKSRSLKEHNRLQHLIHVVYKLVMVESKIEFAFNKESLKLSLITTKWFRLRDLVVRG